MAGLSSLLSPDPVSCFGLGGSMDKLWEKQAVPSFFLGEPLEVMGARGGLGKRNCSVLRGRWLRSSASFRSAKAELGSCG